MEPNAMRLLLHWKTMWSIWSLNIFKEVRTKHDILNSPKKSMFGRTAQWLEALY